MKKSKYLRDEEDQLCKKIRISVDLTRKEREVQKKLKEELDKKKREYGGNWKIKYGKIIRFRDNQRE